METSDRQLLDAALRHDLVAFIIRTFHTVVPGKEYCHNLYIEAVAHQLRESHEGRCRRLIITQPPRTLKSICTSVAYVAWALGHDPSQKFICVSYSNELASDFARLFRLVVNAPWYREIFPAVRAAKDTDVAFETTMGGGRFAISVGGSITGRGGETIIIDDPIKAEEGASKLARDYVIDWYRNTLLSRLNDQAKGSIILVMQRLHEDDLAGYLLERGGWQHLSLQAIATERQEIPLGRGEVYIREPGDVLDPERLPRELLEQIKEEMGTYAYEAQYQQAPVPATGNLFKREWFKRYASPPDRSTFQRIVQSWDTAAKTGQANDYSVCTTWGVAKQNYFLLDVKRKRLEFPDLLRAVINEAKKHSAHSILIEDAASGTALLQALRQETRLNVIRFTSKLDKQTRAKQQTAAIEAGRVIFPKEAPWLAEFEHELLAFPNGRHDDQVDSLVQFLSWVSKHKVIRPKIPVDELWRPSYWQM